MKISNVRLVSSCDCKRAATSANGSEVLIGAGPDEREGEGRGDVLCIGSAIGLVARMGSGNRGGMGVLTMGEGERELFDDPMPAV